MYIRVRSLPIPDSRPAVVCGILESLLRPIAKMTLSNCCSIILQNNGRAPTPNTADLDNMQSKLYFDLFHDSPKSNMTWFRYFQSCSLAHAPMVIGWVKPVFDTCHMA